VRVEQVYTCIIENKEGNNMTNRESYTVYTAKFADGSTIVKTSDDFKHRLDFYNWICLNRLGKGHGGLKEITCRPMPR